MFTMAFTVDTASIYTQTSQPQLKMPGLDTLASPTNVRDEDRQDDVTDMKAFEAGIKPLPAHLFYFMGIRFCLAFCEIVLAVPLIKLFEQSLFFSYYSVHDPSIIENGGSIPEALCKVVEIQQDLATIRGWKSLLNVVPGIFRNPPDHSKASFYAAAAILENIGHAFGDPMMQQIFAAVMGGPVFWLATPFFFAGVSYAACY